METGWFCEFRIPRKTGECLYYETADSIYPVFILEKNGFSFIQFQRLEKKCGCCTRAARKTRIVTSTTAMYSPVAGSVALELPEKQGL